MHRGPVLTQLLIYLFIYNDWRKKLSLTKFAIYAVILGVVLGIVFPHIRGNSHSVAKTVRNQIGVHMWNLSRYIDTTETHGIFGLKPIEMALMIPLPGHQESFEIWVKPFTPISVNIGGASMTLIGEGYMEFKWLGVIGNFFILGILLGWLSRYRQITPWGYMFYTYFLDRSESIIQFGFSKVLITLIIAIVLFVFFNQYDFRQ